VRPQPGQHLDPSALPGGLPVTTAATSTSPAAADRDGVRRRLLDRVFQAIGLIVLAAALLALGALIYSVLRDGLGRLSWDYLTSYTSRHASEAGILPALAGSVFIVVLTAVMAVPLGGGAAVDLEEYGTQSRIARRSELNIANLAAVSPMNSRLHSVADCAC